MTKPLGFIGLGAMGQPMAMRLISAEIPLVVWSRSPASTEPFLNMGAMLADSVSHVRRQVFWNQWQVKLRESV